MIIKINKHIYIFFKRVIFFCDLNDTKNKSLSQNNVKMMFIIKHTYPAYLILLSNIVERNNKENSVKRLIINAILTKVIVFNFLNISFNSIKEINIIYIFKMK